jgi:hypothetical protein
MSEACFTARATLRTQVKDLISEIPLICNENGQYQHDAIVVFKHHLPSHHINMRKEFLTPAIILEMIQLKEVTARTA